MFHTSELNLPFLSNKVKAANMHHTRRGAMKGIKDGYWLLRDAAIAMAEEGCLHAIVVHAKNGNYLRAEHGSKSFKELVC